MQMVPHRIAVGLAGLRDDVADIEDRRLCPVQGLQDLFGEKMRKNAGIQAAGRKDDQVRLSDFLNHFLADMDTVIIIELADVLYVSADGNLAEVFPLPVLADQLHLFLSQRQHRPLDVQQPAHIACRLRKAALEVDERRQHDVAHGMVVETAVLGEAVAQQPDEVLIHIGHGDQHFSHVADRRNVQFLFQNAGAAPVVADGDHGRHVDRELLQPRKQNRESGSAAENNDFFHISRILTVENRESGTGSLFCRSFLS